MNKTKPLSVESKRDAHVHDRMFREIMSHARYATEMVRLILPATYHRNLQAEQLKIMSGVFAHHGTIRHADILYRLPLDGDGPRYLDTLLEHKSYPEPELFYQLNDYLMGVKRLYDPQLPVVVVVVYHGPRPWPQSEHGTAPLEPLPNEKLVGANPLGVLYYYIDLQQNSNPFPQASMGLRAYFKTAATIWRMKNRRYLRRYVRRVLVPLAKVDRADV